MCFVEAEELPQETIRKETEKIVKMRGETVRDLAGSLSMISETNGSFRAPERDVERDNLTFAMHEFRRDEWEFCQGVIERLDHALADMLRVRNYVRDHVNRLEYASLRRDRRDVRL